MATVTPETIESGDHTGRCMQCDSRSAAWWSGGLELCLDCVVTILPKMLIDALADCDRATIYRAREMVQTNFWQGAFARLERETKQEVSP